jgi:hypothetical protein
MVCCDIHIQRGGGRSINKRKITKGENKEKKFIFIHDVAVSV